MFQVLTVALSFFFWIKYRLSVFETKFHFGAPPERLMLSIIISALHLPPGHHHHHRQRSTSLLAAMAPKDDAQLILSVGERIVWHNTAGTVKYIGPVEGTKGTWLGVEWDDPSRGKHNGVHNGHRYFATNSPAETAASFVRSSACSMGQSLLSVLQDLYPSPPEAPAEAEQAALAKGLSESEVRRARAQAKSRTLSAQKTINLFASLSDGHVDRLICRALDPIHGQKPGDLASAAPGTLISLFRVDFS